ncbi:hypothetical protein EIP86_007986 [Pleurotus ostreatoroseus]|nr:hypothetical protein EIP86_007986 [Pleurotus ostreatoroseus]
MLKSVARGHRVPVGRQRTAVVLNEALRTHICDAGCPVDFWLFKRPAHSLVNRFRMYQPVHTSSAPLPSDSRNMDYLFCQPIVVAPSIEATPCQRPGVAVNPPSPHADVAPNLVPDIALNPAIQLVDSSNVTQSFPPRPVDLCELADIAAEWVLDCQSASLREGPCAVCASLVSVIDRTEMTLEDECLQLLFEHEQQVVAWQCQDLPGSQVLCKAAVNEADGTAWVCKACYNALKKHSHLPRNALANGLWIGEVPVELSSLNLFEKYMIARYRHNVCVVTVAGGARKMHANAVVFAQPVAKFCKKLPPSPDELSEVLAVLFTGPCRPTEDDWKRTPLLIRRDKVLAALLWLKANHRDYHDLEIDYDHLRELKLSTSPGRRPVQAGGAVRDLPV